VGVVFATASRSLDRRTRGSASRSPSSRISRRAAPARSRWASCATATLRVSASRDDDAASRRAAGTRAPLAAPTVLASPLPGRSRHAASTAARGCRARSRGSRP
jgi:hypothetical protein